jgi:o-succinylbenzoate synthase
MDAARSALKSWPCFYSQKVLSFPQFKQIAQSVAAHLYQYKLPLNTQNWKVREGLILSWNGGWGEIAPLPGFSQETFEEAKEEVLSLLPNLESAKPTLSSVRFGLSCASKPFPLHPICAPLCALGPRPGFPTIKLKLGHLNLDEAIALTRSLYRQHRLRLDFNRCWDLESALAFASSFNPTDFEYLEEPLNDFEDLIRFSEETRFPIAVDESFLKFSWEKIPSLRAIVIKPTVVGSIPEVPPHLDLILSSSYETGIGLIHIASSGKSSKPLGLDTSNAFLEDLLTSPIDRSRGFFRWKPSPNPFKLGKLCLIASVP